VVAASVEIQVGSGGAATREAETLKREPATFSIALMFLCSSILAQQTARPGGGGLAERFKQTREDQRLDRRPRLGAWLVQDRDGP
jgi:hypothetical protein